ncbi:YciI family protein [Pseudonocardia sichuanensis]
MQYMLMICGVDGEETGETPVPGYGIDEWVAEMDGRGVRRHGDRLRPVSDATTVRVRNNEVLISDGPFAETKEQMYGYDLLECADLDEAIEVASKHPMARFGMVELRPVWPIDEE